MKRRTLSEDGKFYPYAGPKPEKAKVKTVDQKVAERRELEKLAVSVGINPVNPVLGGLSEKDKELIRGGSMSLHDMKTMASIRKIVIPGEAALVIDKMASALLDEVYNKPTANELTEEEKEKIRAGLSLPEMRKIAKDRNIKIPGTVKKAETMKTYLLKADPYDFDSDVAL